VGKCFLERPQPRGKGNDIHHGRFVPGDHSRTKEKGGLFTKISTKKNDLGGCELHIPLSKVVSFFGKTA